MTYWIHSPSCQDWRTVISVCRQQLIEIEDLIIDPVGRNFIDWSLLQSSSNFDDLEVINKIIICKEGWIIIIFFFIDNLRSLVYQHELKRNYNAELRVLVSNRSYLRGKLTKVRNKIDAYFEVTPSVQQTTLISFIIMFPLRKNL